MYLSQAEKIQVEAQEEKVRPRMLSTRLRNAYHDVYCYAFAYEPTGKTNKLLMTVVSGSDSALQSLKAAIDMGMSDMMFGYGTKESESDVQWVFKEDMFFYSQKGQYLTFPMTLNSRRKALAIVHESVIANEGYLFSFEENPAKNVSQLLGGKGFGLPILPEWEDKVYQRLLARKHLIPIPVYADQRLFPDGIHVFSLNMEEEQADKMLESLIKSGEIRFPQAGNGEALESINTLPTYLTEFQQPMVKMLGEKINPTHNPLQDDVYERVHQYPRQLFPVQEHVVTAAVKKLQKQKSIILQGEMSTGKSSLMTAIADVLYHNKNKRGFHSILACPPSLTKKWVKEIKYIIPNANVISVKQTSDLIRYHSEWTTNGRKAPAVPTFFIISFTTLRNDSRQEIGAPYKVSRTVKQIEKNDYLRFGYYCTSCGKPHVHVEKRTQLDEDGNEKEFSVESVMGKVDFGQSRRTGGNMQNSKCTYCGDSLWTKRVPTRYNSFKEWTAHEKRIVHALENNRSIDSIQHSQPEVKARRGYPIKVAAVEYIRRKMSNFADFLIVDEVHELKASNSAQGNALGALVACSKKVVAGTGTLFGGKAVDIYYLLWRMFPYEMVKNGYRYEDENKFNDEFGNTEETNFVPSGLSGDLDLSNTNSRGGLARKTRKTIPGISPFVFGHFMIQNIINVRLKEVWPDPVELVDTPTIFVKPSEEAQKLYDDMIYSFENAIANASRKEKGQLYLAMSNFGISMLDNPFTFPDAITPSLDGNNVIWENPFSIDEKTTMPKEKKLQEIIETEMSEGRKSIVYVKDTGTSVEGRDVRPRLKRKLEEIGAKVAILDTGTTSTDNRSEWLEKKILKENYNVVIVNQELVKVGLDLLCTPTLIYFQFSWSLFTIEQSKKRAWRIGQDQQCRLFYLAYDNTLQRNLAYVIAQKAQATAAINGDITSDGLSAMLGDSGDLQSLLINSIKDGSVLEGSAEDWVSQTTDTARELLARIGKAKQAEKEELQETATIPTQVVKVIEPAATVEDSEAWDNLLDLLVITENEMKEKSVIVKGKGKKSKAATENQLTFDFFAM